MIYQGTEVGMVGALGLEVGPSPLVPSLFAHNIPVYPLREGGCGKCTGKLVHYEGNESALNSKP